MEIQNEKRQTMNKKGQSTFSLFSIALLIISILFLLFAFIFVSDYYGDRYECLKIYGEQYGYKTEFKWWPLDKKDIYHEPTFGCLIYMEDGTKVLLQDFNIADYKKPMER